MAHVHCDHRELQEAGSNRGTAFFRCASCGSLLIVQRDRVWELRPAIAA